MQHPDEGTIHAWLDGQLSAEESAAIEAHSAGCADCAAVIAEAHGLIAASSRIVSALDVVPGGVIPARAQARRPWYASTQLRAAAAVLFVAGASVLVFRERDAETLQQTASRVLAAPDTTVAQELPQSAEEASDPAQSPSAAKAAPGAIASSQRQADGRTERSTANQVAEPKKIAADAAQPAEKDLMAGAESETRATRAAFGQMAKVAPVIVSGVKTLDEAVGDNLKVVKTDTVGAANVTVYQVAQGVEVTLTETMPAPLPAASAMQRERRLQASRSAAAGRRDSAAQAGAAVQSTAAPPPAARANSESARTFPTISITWTDPSSKRIYTLSGALPRERLEEIRKAIEQKKR